ncbi:MAG: hypothetical protein ACRCS3_11600 [Paracoccaceae bacterium]
MPIRFDRQTMSRIRSVARLNAADQTAAVDRRNHGPEVAHQGDEDLIAAIVAAQAQVDAFGIKAGKLRARFTMLDVFRAPGFWADPMIQQALTAPNNDGDVRFSDACMMLKLAAARAGRPDMVWW